MASEINIGVGRGDDENQLFLGEDKEFVIEVLDGPPNNVDLTQGGQPVDVSAFTLLWAVRISDLEADPPLISKTSSSGIAVQGVYNAARQTNTQRVIVTLARADTLGLTSTAFRHSLRRTDLGHNTLLASGAFVLQAATAR